MSEYQELIKSFQKSRNYVRDFLIYGFKSREDFSYKSGRTYDNKRRRIESWLSEYIRTDYSPHGKTLSIALDSSLLGTNPLYRVWKSKSFTSNDIMLHFFFLDLFQDGCSYTAEELSDQILERYSLLPETQLIRKKANEYVKEGILCANRQGKRVLYSMKPALSCSVPGILTALLDAIRFSQLTMPLGFIGSTILDNQRVVNDLFLARHGYCSFTLEDEILFHLLNAMHHQNMVVITNRSNKFSRSQEEKLPIVPMKIFVSTRTGRRFLCGYRPETHRFSTLRLDQIHQVSIRESFDQYSYYRKKLEENLSACFGVSFGVNHQIDTLKLTLYIREGPEDYIYQRLKREGRGGSITHTDHNIFTYEISVFDGNELMPWIKTFIGRILSFESNNNYLVQKFYQDIYTMAKLYNTKE